MSKDHATYYVYQNDGRHKPIRKASDDEVTRYTAAGGFKDDEGIVSGPDLSWDLTGDVYLDR